MQADLYYELHNWHNWTVADRTARFIYQCQAYYGFLSNQRPPKGQGGNKDEDLNGR